MLKTYISSILLIFCGNIYSQKQEFIKNLESDIDNGLYPKTTSIIVSNRDKVVYENYFEGKNKFDKHDTRSVTKSMTSLFLGNMILNGYLSNEEQLINTVKGLFFVFFILFCWPRLNPFYIHSIEALVLEGKEGGDTFVIEGSDS